MFVKTTLVGFIFFFGNVKTDTASNSKVVFRRR